MIAPAAFEERAGTAARLWHRRGLEGEEWEHWLRAGEARLRAAVTDEPLAGTGRAGAPRVRVAGRRGVWRINRHGGLLGPLQGDRYRRPDRLFREVLLSEEVRASGIPTPEVLVALAVRHGLFWRQHLVTAEVEGARTVFAAREDARALEAARELLGQLFDLGLWAHDLHPGNLLWQAREGRCWLIDLAGARLLGRPLDPHERLRRRERFARFFRKHGGSVPPAFA